MIKVKYKQLFLPIALLLISFVGLLAINFLDINLSNTTILISVLKSVIYLSISAVINSLLYVFVPDSKFAKTIGNSLNRIFLNFLTTATYTFSIILILISEANQDITKGIGFGIIAFVIVGTFFRERVLSYFMSIASESERSFTIGDWVSVETDNSVKEYLGQIIDLNRKYMLIKGEDDTIISIPIALLSISVVKNYLDGETPIRFSFEIKLKSLVEVKKITTIINKSLFQVFYLNNFPNTQTEVLISNIENHNVSYSISYWIKPWNNFIPSKLKGEIISVINCNLLNAGLITEDNGHLKFVNDSILSRISLFSTLNYNELSLLTSESQNRNYNIGEIIIKENEEGESMYILLDGLLKVEIQNKDGEVLTVGTIKPGEFFGEMSMLTGELRTATVSSLIESNVVEITKETMAKVIENRPKVIYDLSKVIAERKAANEKYFNNDNKSHNLVEHLMKKIKVFFKVK